MFTLVTRGLRDCWSLESCLCDSSPATKQRRCSDRDRCLDRCSVAKCDEHWNYFGSDDNLGPVAVSIRREKLEDAKENGPQYNYRVIFRTSEENGLQMLENTLRYQNLQTELVLTLSRTSASCSDLSVLAATVASCRQLASPLWPVTEIHVCAKLMTLRGSVLEDSIPSTAKHGTARGLPLKEVLEHIIPELNVQGLRLAFNTPKVTEQLMKLDEQGLSYQLKVGIMYCKVGQSTEEEMYNNESAGPAFEEFLQLLGERVRLKGFEKYRAQLDTKTDSTGTHSLYTTYKDYEIMFHVSTMLPYTPNNKQQLLRKRHIGNDIVTIVFQEPGAQPFSPKNIRSHFQHVFVVVRAHNPCTDSVCYRRCLPHDIANSDCAYPGNGTLPCPHPGDVDAACPHPGNAEAALPAPCVAVTRSRDVPAFGPPIPKSFTFPKSTVFRDFLLTKVINAENAAHKSEKFRAMATRTHQEYLKDLAEKNVTNTSIDSSGKFPFISLASKKKEKAKPYPWAELYSTGAIVWSVQVEDFSNALEIECLLCISNEILALLDQETKNVIFNCSSRDVIGWTSNNATVKIFYERGECVFIRSYINNSDEIKEIVKRLEIVTKGCESVEMTLRRNGLGQLGFHVNYEGIVAEVEPYGYAWQAGLRQGSRLVEICKVAVATLSHEQMIDLLRTSVTVKVVIIPPHDDGIPRSISEEREIEYPGTSAILLLLRSPAHHVTFPEENGESVPGSAGQYPSTIGPFTLSDAAAIPTTIRIAAASLFGRWRAVTQTALQRPTMPVTRVNIGGCSETYRMPTVEYKMTEGIPYELKFPFRNNNKWQRNTGKGEAAQLRQIPSQLQSPVSSRVSSVKGDGKMQTPERPPTFHGAFPAMVVHWRTRGCLRRLRSMSLFHLSLSEDPSSVVILPAIFLPPAILARVEAPVTGRNQCPKGPERAPSNCLLRQQYALPNCGQSRKALVRMLRKYYVPEVFLCVPGRSLPLHAY
ncbi:unnamed protein product [Ranitomeya imitator]|uniref:Signal-induced proliferation-associated 1-like protein 1 n=1 Tax=Ranitomeya imitator TaxID=111125 RepID=A0ABN9M683_9NEOB|nr:unnamed protein product [Ranitomeya imitator]